MILVNFTKTTEHGENKRTWVRLDTRSPKIEWFLTQRNDVQWILGVPNFETVALQSSLPQRKSGSDLEPSTGVAPWHGFSMEMGTLVTAKEF